MDKGRGEIGHSFGGGFSFCQDDRKKLAFSRFVSTGFVRVCSLLRCFLRHSLAFVKVQSKQSHGIGKPNNVSILRGDTVHKLSNRYSALASSDVRSFRVLSHSERSKQWPKWSSNLSFWNIVSVFLVFCGATSLIFSFTLTHRNNEILPHRASYDIVRSINFFYILSRMVSFKLKVMEGRTGSREIHGYGSRTTKTNSHGSRMIRFRFHKSRYSRHVKHSLVLSLRMEKVAKRCLKT